MTRKFIYLTAIAFILAVFHACSLNNNILTPACKVFEADLVDRWWYLEGNDKSGIRFNSDGSCLKKSSHDNMTYTLTSCNKIKITNHTAMKLEEMEIGKLIPTQAMIIVEGKAYQYYPSTK